MTEYKLKSGEIVDIEEEKPPALKKMVNGDNLYAKVIMAIVKSNRPLRLSEIEKKSGIYRQKLLYKLKEMKALGLILTFEDGGVKFYQPQSVFRNNEVLYALIELLKPLIKAMDDVIDYSQSKSQEIAITNCLQTSMNILNLNLKGDNHE